MSTNRSRIAGALVCLLVSCAWVAALLADQGARQGRAQGGPPPKAVPVIRTAQDLLEPGGHEASLRVGKSDRWFIVYTPTGYRQTERYPLVIALHGAHGGMVNMYDTREDLKTIARERKFIVAFPNGQNGTDHRRGRSFWNADFCCDLAMRSGINDVEFVVRMTDYLTKVMSVDPARIHLVGFSNGGMLTQKIAAEQPGRYASFVSMGAVPGYYTDNGRTKWTYKMTAPVPVMLMHGTLDRTIDFNGGVPENDSTRKTLSFAESLAAWASHNSCAGKPAVETGEAMPGRGRGNQVAVQRFSGCRADTVGIAVPGVAHTWIDVNSTGVNGSLRAVEFFEQHPKR